MNSTGWCLRGGLGAGNGSLALNQIAWQESISNLAVVPKFKED